MNFMKSKTFILLFLCSFGHAGNWMDSAYGLWGLGAVIRDQNYINTDLSIGPGVFIFGGFGPLFIEANRAGISFYRDGTYFGSAIVQLRTHQFLKDHKNLSNRKLAFEAGVQFGRRLPAGLVTRLAFLHDISDAHNSYELDLQLYRHNFIGPFRILTALGMQYQASKLVNYYYGTSEYSPQAAFAGELEIIITFPLNHWGIFTGTRIYGFNKEVSQSPIADGFLINQFFCGIGYHF